MDDNEKLHLLMVIDIYSNICINISLFTEFLKDSYWSDLFDPITDRQTLKSGLYGYLGKKRAKCWVSRSVDENCIKVSNEDVTGSQDACWSTNLKLKDSLNQRQEVFSSELTLGKEFNSFQGQ